MISIGGRPAPGLAAAALALLVAGFAARFLAEPAQVRTAGSHAISSPTGPRQAISRVLSHWYEPASRLIWIYTIGIGAFYGTIQVVPLLLMKRLNVTEQNIGYFVMYLGGMGVVVRSLLLGRMVDWLGEARLSRLGLVLLATGLICTGVGGHPGMIYLGFTLMPSALPFCFRVSPDFSRGWCRERNADSTWASSTLSAEYRGYSFRSPRVPSWIASEWECPFGARGCWCSLPCRSPGLWPTRCRPSRRQRPRCGRFPLPISRESFRWRRWPRRHRERLFPVQLPRQAEEPWLVSQRTQTRVN